MSIATRLEWYLNKNHVDYDCVAHEHSRSSLESARGASVDEHRVAKCVLLEDERGYVNAILPADEYVNLASLQRELDRKLEFASEYEIGEIFFDCELGAIPALTIPYGIPTVIDRSMLDLPEIYFESGDHETLVHLSGAEFARVMADATPARFAIAS